MCLCYIESESREAIDLGSERYTPLTLKPIVLADGETEEAECL